jgi:uncharacterized membrane protein
MGGRDRTPPNYYAVGAFILGVVAFGLAVVLISGTWRNPCPLPWARSVLRDAAWAGRWAWPALVAAFVGFLASLAATEQVADGSDTRRRRSILAQAGLWLATVSGGIVVFTVVFLPVWTRRSDPELKIQCYSNVRNIAMALSVYADDYDRLPAQARWCDTLEEYLRNPDVYRCPQAQARCGFAYNTALDAIETGVVDPARVPAVFDADGGWNAHGGKELLSDFPRHLGGDNYGFPDGHAAWYARKRPPGEVRWDTKWPQESSDTRLRWGPKRKPQPP